MTILWYLILAFLMLRLFRIIIYNVFLFLEHILWVLVVRVEGYIIMIKLFSKFCLRSSLVWERQLNYLHIGYW